MAREESEQREELEGESTPSGAKAEILSPEVAAAAEQPLTAVGMADV